MSFWEVHGLLGGAIFLLLLAVLPRLTMLFTLALAVGMSSWLTEPLGLSGLTGFGFSALKIIVFLLGWALWLLLPRFLAAFLGSVLYMATNPILCILAWLVAFLILKGKMREAKRQAAEAAAKAQAAHTEAEQQYAQASGTGQQKKKPASPPPRRAPQWWEILGVNPNASVDSIKAAYRRMAKATHPDTAPSGDGDAEKFQQASEAYRKGLNQRGG